MDHILFCMEKNDKRRTLQMNNKYSKTQALCVELHELDEAILNALKNKIKLDKEKHEEYEKKVEEHANVVDSQPVVP